VPLPVRVCMALGVAESMSSGLFVRAARCLLRSKQHAWHPLRWVADGVDNGVCSK